jgi:AcrR family transcriptional regulator
MSPTAPPKRKYRMVARAEATAATRERILAAAWRRFSARPYEQVRLADIAADAGVTVPTVHSRFGTKDDLFVAAWAWAIGPEGARRDAAPVGDVRTAVKLIYHSYELTGDAVLRLLAQEERISAVRAMTDRGRAWHRAWVERTFAPMLAGLKGAARERRVVSLVVATDLLVWKLLRREMGLGRRTAERIVVEMVDNATKGAP